MRLWEDHALVCLCAGPHRVWTPAHLNPAWGPCPAPAGVGEASRCWLGKARIGVVGWVPPAVLLSPSPPTLLPGTRRALVGGWLGARSFCGPGAQLCCPFSAPTPGTLFSVWKTGTNSISPAVGDAHRGAHRMLQGRAAKGVSLDLESQKLESCTVHSLCCFTALFFACVKKRLCSLEPHEGAVPQSLFTG